LLELLNDGAVARTFSSGLGVAISDSEFMVRAKKKC